MAELLHHNDGKNKSQSHEIYSKDLENNFDIFLQGFGITKEEAFSDFVEKLDEYIKKLNDFRATIQIEETVKADCFGKPV